MTGAPALSARRAVTAILDAGRARRLLAGLVVALFLLARVAPIAALAHANLERAEPAVGAPLPPGQPPKELRLFFTEEVDPGFSRVQVFNARRDRVDRGDSHVAPDNPREMIVSLNDGLPDGLYTVSWRTLSLVDGHSVTGAYPLVVGSAPAGQVAGAESQALFAPETAAARWWFDLAAAGLIGSLLVWLLVFAPLLPAADGVRAAALGSLRRLALLSAVLLVLGTLYAALAQAAVAAGVPLWSAAGSPVADLLSRGRFAGIWWSRLALVLAAAALIAWRGPAGWAGRLALLLMAGALLSGVLNSHAAALASGSYLAIGVDWLHVAATTAWIGGLAALAAALAAALRSDRQRALALAAGAAGRFSTFAIAAVLVLGATGVFNAWLQVGSLEGLWQTAYGWMIDAKTAGLLLMLGLAGFNLLVARPRLASLAKLGKPESFLEPVEGNAGSMHTARHFILAVRVEAAIGVLVLVAAAILTGIPPAREQLAQQALGARTGPVDRQVNAQGLQARVQITPATVGQNHFRVELSGADPAIVERVQLTLTYLDAELGEQPLVLPSAGSGVWEADSPLLSQPGQWQAELFVRRTGMDDARSAFRFGVTGAGGAPPPGGAAAAYPLLPSPMVSFALLCMALGVLGVAIGAWRAVRGSAAARRGVVALLGAGALLAGYGGYVYAQEQQGVPLDVINVRNPVPPDARSLAAGKEIYNENCAACHGVSGRGDGPAGITLRPRPADLRVHMAAGHTDGQLFYWLSYGVAGTAMPAWKDKLTEQQRWDVLNYIRTFAPAAGANQGSR